MPCLCAFPPHPPVSAALKPIILALARPLLTMRFRVFCPLPWPQLVPHPAAIAGPDTRKSVESSRECRAVGETRPSPHTCFESFERPASEITNQIPAPENSARTDR